MTDITYVTSVVRAGSAPKKKGHGMGMEKGWHRRQAIQIAASLPEDDDDARIVLKLVNELLNTFLARKSEDQEREAVVLAFSDASRNA
jgi:hypothetical protein